MVTKKWENIIYSWMALPLLLDELFLWSWDSPQINDMNKEKVSELRPGFQAKRRIAKSNLEDGNTMDIFLTDSLIK